MTLRDFYGYPVVFIRNKPIVNIIRALIHTSLRYTLIYAFMGSSYKSLDWTLKKKAKEILSRIYNIFIIGIYILLISLLFIIKYLKTGWHFMDPIMYFIWFGIGLCFIGATIWLCSLAKKKLLNNK